MRELQKEDEAMQGADEGSAALEVELRRALRPAALPEGFAERTRLRLAERQRQRVRGWMWRGVAAAVLLAVILLSGWQISLRRARRERAEAAAAKQQFALAMQVTARTLRRASRGAERRADRGDE